MKALVAGANGETGRRIVQALVERGVPVRAMVRNPQGTSFPAGVEVVTADVMQPGTLSAALEGCSVLLCATGARPSFDPTGPYQVDYQGTLNLVNAAKGTGVEHFVLVSSLCVSKFFHPLNLFFLILAWKRKGEAYLQSSGLRYTIVRPGGLKNEDNSDGIVMASADQLFEGSIPRTKVAQACVEALFEPAAHNKIIEVVARPDQPSQSWQALFSAV
jgi:uncharacterized protein YbjT (DUF2867 family)